MVSDTKEAAIKEALFEGYKDTKRNLLRELSKTTRFQKGNDALVLLSHKIS